MSDLRILMKQIHEQLLVIREQHGELTPQSVVDAARGKRHPLHSRFEWDDSVAAEAYRRVQAAELIRSVRVSYISEPDNEQRSVRGWSSLQREQDPDRRGYVPTEELLEDPFARKLLLRQCERDIKALQRKYGHLKEFADLIAGIAEAS